VKNDLPLPQRFRAKGNQENEKTVAMAPLGFLQKDVKTAHSTKTMILYDFFTFWQKQLMLPAHMKTVLSFVGIHAIIGFSPLMIPVLF